MCVSLALAKFTNTIVAAWEISEKLHALGYQNKAQHLAPDAAGANAMILPIPAVPGTLTRKNLLDTTSCKNILDDMAKALEEPCRGVCFGTVGEEAPSVDIFDFDVYTVVLAQNARDIPAALQHVAEDKRPALNNAIFHAYADWYPNWPVAVCCFRNTDLRKAAPLVWTYEPASPGLLFLPALDAHDGNVPKLNGEVNVDHTVIVGSYRMHEERGVPVTYTDQVPEDIRKFLPTRVEGDQFETTMPQGDFLCLTAEVAEGILNFKRVLPPGVLATADRA